MLNFIVVLSIEKNFILVVVLPIKQRLGGKYWNSILQELYYTEVRYRGGGWMPTFCSVILLNIFEGKPSMIHNWVREMEGTPDSHFFLIVFTFCDPFMQMSSLANHFRNLCPQSLNREYELTFLWSCVYLVLH